MASQSLLPPVNNQTPREPKYFANPLSVIEEMGYGEQLSTFTELERGVKTKPLFVSEQPLESGD
jgi:hypothetical protein